MISDSATKIWANLNLRCIERFGNKDYIKSDVSISDITWACTTLPAYRSWDTMKDYYDDIDRWLAKLNDFSMLNLYYQILKLFLIILIIKASKFSRYCSKYQG